MNPRATTKITNQNVITNKPIKKIKCTILYFKNVRLSQRMQRKKQRKKKQRKNGKIANIVGQ